jgi:hypothetical protein
MSTNLDESTSITMPKGTLLVLFEYLARSYGSWKEASAAPDEASFALQPPDTGERKALWRLEGEIERTLPEVFSPDYRQLIAEWKERLTSN